jgi:hypothetical protein
MIERESRQLYIDAVAAVDCLRTKCWRVHWTAAAAAAAADTPKNNSDRAHTFDSTLDVLLAAQAKHLQLVSVATCLG